MTRQQITQEFLLVAASTRFIAESALACGYVFSSVDGFADAEVHSPGRRAVRVPLVGGELSAAHVREACECLFRERQFDGVVIGPGLDAHPGLVEWLHLQAPVYANDAEVFSCCRDRPRFLEQLDRLDIPRPCEGWGAPPPTLLKAAGASGGTHVRFGSAAAGFYRQSYLPGTVASYLFFASEGETRSIGWNTQWQSRHDSGHPFCYGGALNRGAHGAAIEARVEDHARRLARALSLKGVNGIDYVVVGDEAYLLELNPRISATLQLHDRAGELFAGHLVSCTGVLPPAPAPVMPRAHAVLYAPYSLAISRGFDWPENACDLPLDTNGRTVRFAAGDPVCTLFASAATPAATLTKLQQDIRRMNARFVDTCQTDTASVPRVASGGNMA